MSYWHEEEAKIIYTSAAWLDVSETSVRSTFALKLHYERAGQNVAIFTSDHVWKCNMKQSRIWEIFAVRNTLEIHLIVHGRRMRSVIVSIHQMLSSYWLSTSIAVRRGRVLPIQE